MREQIIIRPSEIVVILLGLKRINTKKLTTNERNPGCVYIVIPTGYLQYYLTDR